MVVKTDQGRNTEYFVSVRSVSECYNVWKGLKWWLNHLVSCQNNAYQIPKGYTFNLVYNLVVNNVNYVAFLVVKCYKRHFNHHKLIILGQGRTFSAMFFAKKCDIALANNAKMCGKSAVEIRKCAAKVRSKFADVR